MGKRGPPPMEPTDEQRQQVEMLAAVGVPQDAMAELMGFEVKKLVRYFRRELDVGLHKANAKVAGRLYNNAMSGDNTAAIFWLKTRGRWRETPQAYEHSGPNGEPIQLQQVETDAAEFRRRLLQAPLTDGTGPPAGVTEH
jgi:hypothetical protein